MIQQILTGGDHIEKFYDQFTHKIAIAFLCVNELLHCFWEFTIAWLIAMAMNNVGFCKFTFATSDKH
jgi:hypothetical protein